ncbi:glycosyltransferase [candidate division KSB1 bacterium]|nr:glycosyltransferase [candidate division KSB1 bacterium]
MPIIFIFIFFNLGLLFVITLFNFLTAPMLRKSYPINSKPAVSILIPARNEARTISNCLDNLLNQDYPLHEIIVLNDHSEDSTQHILDGYSKKHPHIHCLHGLGLPSGWTGKNWACQQLAKVATGDILIFTDADTKIASHAVRHTIGWMQQFRLDMLSTFPQQIMLTLIEKLVVPVMDLFVYTTLPLWATYWSRRPSLAAANGQWIAFTRTAYNTLGGHESVKQQIVEDTELARMAKRNGLKTITTAGTGTVFCRMYENFPDVWFGFTKNFFGLTGYNSFLFWIIEICLWLAFIVPYGLLLHPGLRPFALIAVGANMLIRLMLSLKYRHPLTTSVVLHPFGILIATFIGLNSFRSYLKGEITWKNRTILFPKS